MKHEKFKLLSVERFSDLSTSTDVNNFLATDITPKSVSVTSIVPGVLVCIGYTEEKSDHEYHLVPMILVAAGGEREELEMQIEAAASGVGGVVCQDVHFGNSKQIEIVFLTTK